MQYILKFGKYWEFRDSSNIPRFSLESRKFSSFLNEEFKTEKMSKRSKTSAYYNKVEHDASICVIVPHRKWQIGNAGQKKKSRTCLKKSGANQSFYACNTTVILTCISVVQKHTVVMIYENCFLDQFNM